MKIRDPTGCSKYFSENTRSFCGSLAASAASRPQPEFVATHCTFRTVKTFTSFTFRNTRSQLSHICKHEAVSTVHS